MPAHINLEIEGTVEEILEAFKQFIGPVTVLEEIPEQLKDQRARKAPKREKATPKILSCDLSLMCKECGKVLTTRGQKQFCSRKCSNYYHKKQRLGIKITKKAPLLTTIVAGQGIIKGTALNPS